MEPKTADNPFPREIRSLLSHQRVVLRETSRAVTPLGGVAVFVAFCRIDSAKNRPRKRRNSRGTTFSRADHRFITKSRALAPAMPDLQMRPDSALFPQPLKPCPFKAAAVQDSNSKCDCPAQALDSLHQLPNHPSSMNNEKTGSRIIRPLAQSSTFCFLTFRRVPCDCCY